MYSGKYFYAYLYIQFYTYMYICLCMLYYVHMCSMCMCSYVHLCVRMYIRQCSNHTKIQKTVNNYLISFWQKELFFGIFTRFYDGIGYFFQQILQIFQKERKKSQFSTRESSSAWRTNSCRTF